MSGRLTIKDYFKPPSFSRSREEPARTSENELSRPSDRPTTQSSDDDSKSKAQSSPQGVKAYVEVAVERSHNAEVKRQQSSFTTQSSHRIVKNGEEMVIDSDDESIGSMDTVDASDDLLNAFLKPDSLDYSGGHRSKTKPPAYKFSLESLVTQTVDDNEAEAGVARAKAAMNDDDNDEDKEIKEDKAESQIGKSDLKEETLVSALGNREEGTSVQRLLEAIRRTEALEVHKTWSFFQESSATSAPEFPTWSIDPSSREQFLRVQDSRERAFLSGIVDFALSMGQLPDDLVYWILRSAPLESRDDLRYAYCRALKHCSPHRIASLVSPDEIDDLFRSLGASRAALNMAEPVIPVKTVEIPSPQHNRSQLLSVIDLLREIFESLNIAAKERVLNILLRLTLDTTVSKDNLICATLQNTIEAILQGSRRASNDFEEMINRVCRTAFDTVKDVILQSRLLRNFLPSSPELALIRCRLAVAFLVQDSSPLTEPVEELLDLRRITRCLRDSRFDVKRDKKGSYDYAELNALTVLLNIAIDQSLSAAKFPDKQAERDFNADVDALAERIKRIFSAIEDSGASHLRRTEAKQSLEALHYRVIYSVRTKPPAKKSFFSNDHDDWNDVHHGGNLLTKFLAKDNPNKMAAGHS